MEYSPKIFLLYFFLNQNELVMIGSPLSFGILKCEIMLHCCGYLMRNKMKEQINELLQLKNKITNKEPQSNESKIG